MLSVFCKLFDIVLQQVFYLVAGLRALYVPFKRIKGMPTTLIITEAYLFLAGSVNYLPLYLIIGLTVI